MRILVVQPIPETALKLLRDVAEVEVYPHTDRMISKDELIARVKHADILFTLGEVTVDAEVMDANHGLQLIAAMTKAPGTVDISAATARGIPVTNVSAYLGDATCDLAMAHMLGLATRLVEADHATRAGQFRQEYSMFFLTTAFSRKTLGLIGLGRIGEGVARRARAFDLRVIYSKRNRLDDERERELGIQFSPLDDLLRQSDFVSIHCPYHEATHHLIGEREFSLMKPTSFLVNTARGRIVDEQALISALRSGRIAGAGLDVYPNEPPFGEPRPNPELFKLDNVILTPHIGSATRETRERMATDCAKNVLAVLGGQRPPDLLNPEAYAVRAARKPTH